MKQGILYLLGGLLAAIGLSAYLLPTGCDPLLRSILGTKIEFYGQVLDLEDQPVAGAKIRYGALNAANFAKVWEEGVPKVVLTADKEGRFSIRAKGGSLTVYASKEGYYKLVGQSSGDFGYGFSDGQKPSSDPENPVIFRLRKKGETEPLVYFDGPAPARSWIRVANGKSIYWDLSTGKIGKSPTSILVSQKHNKPPRKDNNYDPRKYDWSFTMKIPGGGLTKRQGGRFDFIAPEEGYEESVTISMDKDDPDWTVSRNLSHEYFVKFPNGNYARIMVRNSTGGFRYESHLNPSGSRNLEYDKTKRIRPNR